jgi:hypothetical protein
MNYLKRLAQGSGASRLGHWKKWVTTLSQCGKRRQGEEKKCTLAMGNWTKRA